MVVSIQAGFAQFLNSATSNTAGVPNTVKSIIGRVLGIVYYLILVGLFIAIIYYGAQLAFSQNPDEAKRKLMYVVAAFLAVFLLPKIIDWITTGSS